MYRTVLPLRKDEPMHTGALPHAKNERFVQKPWTVLANSMPLRVAKTMAVRPFFGMVKRCEA